MTVPHSPAWRIPRFFPTNLSRTEQTSLAYQPTRLSASFQRSNNLRVKCMHIISYQVPQLLFYCIFNSQLQLYMCVGWTLHVKRQATHQPLNRKRASHFVSDKGLQHPKTPPANPSSQMPGLDSPSSVNCDPLHTLVRTLVFEPWRSWVFPHLSWSYCSHLRFAS